MMPPMTAGVEVPESGNSGVSGISAIPTGVGVAVPQMQLVLLRQLGFRQKSFEQTMLLAQSALLVQESPQESGGAGVGVGVGVASSSHRQFVLVLQLGFRQNPPVQVIPLPHSVLSVQALLQSGGVVGVGVGVGVGVTLGLVDGLELGLVDGLALGLPEGTVIEKEIVHWLPLAAGSLSGTFGATDSCLN